jgi:hypothetical protein
MLVASSQSYTSGLRVVRSEGQNRVELTPTPRFRNLLTETLNELFAKYGEPEIAPVGTVAAE